jgi:hypothetical protein
MSNITRPLLSIAFISTPAVRSNCFVSLSKAPALNPFAKSCRGVDQDFVDNSRSPGTLNQFDKLLILLFQTLQHEYSTWSI